MHRTLSPICPVPMSARRTEETVLSGPIAPAWDSTLVSHPRLSSPGPAMTAGSPITDSDRTGVARTSRRQHALDDRVGEEPMVPGPGHLVDGGARPPVVRLHSHLVEPAPAERLVGPVEGALRLHGDRTTALQGEDAGAAEPGHLLAVLPVASRLAVGAPPAHLVVEVHHRDRIGAVGRCEAPVE